MSRKIKAIVIDDEARARRLLTSTLQEYCEDVEVIAEAENVPNGVLEINKHKPDVVFLDIEMPEYSGFELLGFFREVDFEIIFVTAYNQYAIKAFEVSAVDYLLKPVRIDTLNKAIDKLKTKLNVTSMFDRLSTLKANMHTGQIEKIAIPVSDGLVFVKVEDISHLEADGSYCKVFLLDGSNLLVSKKLKYFEDILAQRDNFYRAHRLFLLNLDGITKYNRHDSILILENGTKIKVARDKKTELEALLAARSV